MSIKQNIKRRLVMVLALTMTVAVLAAGTAQAATLGSTKLTDTPDKAEVHAGQQVTFTIAERNISNQPISGVIVTDKLGDLAQFVQAKTRDGGGLNYDSKTNQVQWKPVTLQPSGKPGDTAYLYVTVSAKNPGPKPATMLNNASDNKGNRALASVNVLPR
jgi:uncharacterized repeat protein (TIGR01451 family)